MWYSPAEGPIGFDLHWEEVAYIIAGAIFVHTFNVFCIYAAKTLALNAGACTSVFLQHWVEVAVL